MISLLLLAILAQNPQAGSAVNLEETWSYVATGNKLNILEVHTSVGEYPSIYVSGNAGTYNSWTYWHVLQFDPLAGEYISTRSSRHYDNPSLLGLDVADVMPAAGDEIVVYLQDGSYEVLDRTTWQVLASGQSTVINPDSAITADVDADGFADLIFSESGSGGTEGLTFDGQVLFTLNDGNSRIAVGNVDADPAMELVFEDGVYDLGNLASVALQWDYPTRFGSFKLADYDHDGMEEIIAEKFGNTLRFYDVDLQVESSVVVLSSIRSFNVLDVDEDGDTEILTAHFIQPTELIAWDAETMVEEWRFDAPNDTPVSVAIADFDLDGSTELVWLSGTGSGERLIQIAAWPSGAVEWESTHFDGPFVGAELGDLDGDGIEELVTASRDSKAGSWGGRIIVLDPLTGRLLGLSEPVGPPALGGSEEIFDIRLRDIDQDGEVEIVVATDWYGHGNCEIYSYAAGVFTLDWTNVDRPYYSPFAAVDVVDLDGDGTLEVCATVADHPNTLVDDNYLYVFDYATGLEEFRSAEMGITEVASPGLQVGDFDQDGSLEVAAMVRDGSIFIYDGATMALEATISGQHHFLSQMEYAGEEYLLAGTTPGDVAVYALVGGSYQWVFSQYVGNSPVDATHVISVGSNRYLFNLSAEEVVLTPMGSTTPLWSTNLWGPSFGKFFTFTGSPTPGFYATSDHGLHFFERQ